jgi:curved DNA-binding protein CbpA
MTETFYDVLGVPENADSEAIRTAYREAIKEVHPDVSDDIDAGERTKRLNEAKRVLTDADERARYDRLGHAAYTGETDSTDTGPSNTTDDGGSSEPDETSRESSRSRDGTASTSDRTDRTGSNGSTWRGRQSAHGRRSETGRRGTDRWDSETRSDGADGATAAGGGVDGSRRTDDARRASDSRQGGPTGTAAGGSAAGGATASGAVSGAGASGRDATAAGSAATGDPVGGTRPRSQPGGEPAGTDQSTRRRAAARHADSSSADQSWNAWESTRSWSVRQGSDTGSGFGLDALLGPDQSLLLFASTFFLYPFFVVSSLVPLFPLAARAVVAVCTVLMFAYLLSVPGIAIAVFGTWSLVFPVAVLALPGVSLFSLAGVVGLVTTWVPLGLSVLTLSVLRS